MNPSEAILSMYQDIEMPGGWRFNHIGMLKTIDLMYTSHFETGEYDEMGMWKFYYNIVKTPCDVAEKFIDLNTKDFLFLPQPSLSTGEPLSNELMVWHMTKDFKIYADVNKFGEIIDELRPDLPKYGMCIAKDVNGLPQRRALHNMRWDPTARTLRKSHWVAEAYLFTESEIREQKWNKMDNFDAVKQRGESNFYLVYEFYEKHNGRYKRNFYIDVFAWNDGKGGTIRSLETNINYSTDRLPAISLHEDMVDDIPYYDHYWEKIDGRTLGYGFVEYLIQNQISVNEAENIERQGLYYSSMVLLQTRDTAIGGKNVLTGTRNGDILTIDSEITKVPLEERNLAAYNATRDRWNSNTVAKTFSSEIATGGNLPSRTPIGVANLQLSQVTSYYQKKQDAFGQYLKTLVYDIVIPSFQKQTAAEHALSIGSSDSDIVEYQKLLTKIYYDKAVSDYADKHGYFPNQGQRELIQKQIAETLSSRKNIPLRLPAFYYDNAEYTLHIEVTGESMDKAVNQQALQTAMQILSTNPGILQNSTLRTIFFRFMTLSGISPQELGIDLTNIDQTPVQQGGSISPGQAQQPMPQQASMTM